MTRSTDAEYACMNIFSLNFGNLQPAIILFSILGHLTQVKIDTEDKMAIYMCQWCLIGQAPVIE